jgi:hypothetical protein
LPDGRVLKGSRPAQRKQARFWSGVEEESSSLLSSTSPTREAGEGAAPAPTPQKPAARPPRPAHPRPQTGGAAHRAKIVRTARASNDGPREAGAKVGKKKGRGPQKPVTRPSQRGYKWPAAEE